MAFLVLWLLHSPALEYTHALRKKKIMPHPALVEEEVPGLAVALYATVG